jgi:hypothetical protein
MVKKAAIPLVVTTRNQPTRTHHQGRLPGGLLARGVLQRRVDRYSQGASSGLKFKSHSELIICVTLTCQTLSFSSVTCPYLRRLSLYFAK